MSPAVGPVAAAIGRDELARYLRGSWARRWRFSTSDPSRPRPRSRTIRRDSGTGSRSRSNAPSAASRGRWWCRVHGRPRDSATTIRPTAHGRPCTATAPTTRSLGTRAASTWASSMRRASSGRSRTRRNSSSSWRRSTGTLYWLDLERLLEAPLREIDVARAQELGRFLAEVHAAKRDEPTLYHRRIRELIGHGECLMGVLDSYPHPYSLLPPEVCEDIERTAVSWRWRLRNRAHRLSRAHGDFHPWNLLFREGTDFSVLDRSRGEWGEPADDVAALGVNYLFYGLRSRAPESFHYLFCTFLETYLRASHDQRDPGDPSSVSRVPRARHRAPALVPGALGSASDGPHPLRP